ncbi:MAG TPA: isoleucine--tRNA ligase [Thermoplasmatales archaeon]|nr:isoleucine--tRNA ligase [Thermoplasmatales archaeon]
MDAKNYPKMEEEILKYWEENSIFEKSVEKNRGREKFVFLEGPPTANGLPHPGHVLTRTMKDVVLRYKTMRGYYVERKAGWDTHGLPVEIEVEKSLGLKNKQEIEKYGIEKFNEECKKSVFRYEKAWKEMTRRVAFWIDMENPYITLDTKYIESVWWSLKEAWKKGLLYRGYRVTPYCPRCGTTLSSHEVAQGYREVEDPSIFIKFKVKGKDEYFLAWTTTPWTLISNVALAVHPDEWYMKIEYEGEKLILAEERMAVLLKNQEYRELDRIKGKELEGIEYEPLYQFIEPEKKCWFVILADFVTMDEGTGIVHIATAFGEEDYEAGLKYDLPVIQLVDLEGKFKKEVKKWAGRFVKDVDEEIIKDLDERGLLAGRQKYRHQYPFCWRCDSPLLYYAIESWFIGMSKLRKNLVKNNEEINWYPNHLKQGRFGEFIKEARDWALSRKRYWGTPLPIWKCNECKKEICIGSIEELKEMAINFPEKLDLHRPYVDEILLKCSDCGKEMRRVEEVIDAWYDSGSAFFAQWHYPFENEEKFMESFPYDFICEAIDQTRGWFYSLLAVSTLVFDKPSYKNVLTLGLILDENGQKMSKKARNYVEPNEIFSKYGADALRWYLVSVSPPWQPKRFYEKAVKEVLSKFLLTFWNVFSFYKTYASLDDFDYEKDFVEFEKRRLIDKWILSRINKLIFEVEEKMEVFEVHKASRLIENFVINDLSNWYIRNSRKRFWTEERSTDKMAGYSTLYEILITLSKIMAPFVPFVSEKIYIEMEKEESVHLCSYPESNDEMIDDSLEDKMETVRKIVEEARALRAKNGIKLRYPLKEIIIVSNEEIGELAELIKEEINVKNIIFNADDSTFMEKVAKPNYSKLGPKYKDNAKKVAEIIEKTDAGKLNGMKILLDGIEYVIGKEEFLIEKRAKEGYAIGKIDDILIALNTKQTSELLAEGFAREIIRRIQEMRKELNLEMEEKISVEIDIERGRIEGWEDYVKNETRSEKMEYKNPECEYVKEWNIDGEKIKIGIRKE